MKLHRLLTLSLVGSLASGCANYSVSTLPDYQRYFDPEFPPAPLGNKVGPQKDGTDNPNVTGAMDSGCGGLCYMSRSNQTISGSEMNGSHYE
jgi:hypothetical protein